MTQVTYRGLAEFGLPLVTPEDPSFLKLVREMERLPHAFVKWTESELGCAAVLCNESGKAVVGLSHCWRYTRTDGTTQLSRLSNFGSSRQMDFLAGRAPLVRDPFNSILPGSKRLIAEGGMYGNNLDVLPDFELGRGGGGGGWMGTRGGRDNPFEEMSSIELILDFALFEDGLCAGPDDTQMMESIIEGLEQQGKTRSDLIDALQSGASPGELFELLLPIARVGPGHPWDARNLAMNAIHQLVRLDKEQFLEWLEGEVRSSPITLHRAS